jgi:hypothetical protein
LCQLVVPVVMDFSREVTGARRLEMEDASAQGAMVISTRTSPGRNPDRCYRLTTKNFLLLFLPSYPVS